MVLIIYLISTTQKAKKKNANNQHSSKEPIQDKNKNPFLPFEKESKIFSDLQTKNNMSDSKTIEHNTNEVTIHNTEKDKKRNFNAKQAIIYSAILERPYKDK